MSEIVLGSEVPHLLVILQSGATNKFAITLQVEPAELDGVEGHLDINATSHVAVLSGSTYTWTLSIEEVASIASRSSAKLSLVNPTGRTLLGRGIVEIRS